MCLSHVCGLRKLVAYHFFFFRKRSTLFRKRLATALQSDNRLGSCLKLY